MKQIPDSYRVEKIAGKIGKEYIRENHYSRSCHNGPMCWGLYDGAELIGVCAFATPASENVRASLFGPDYKDAVTELHRLHIKDVTPTNTESWFIARALRGLKSERPSIRAVISFADSTEGHSGTIYQAMNALYCGNTGRARFWRDGEGRLRHPRQNGHNVTPEEAKSMGWVPEMRDSKYRYVIPVLNNESEKRWFKHNFKLNAQPYPSRQVTEKVAA